MPHLSLHGEFVRLVPLQPAHAAVTLRWRQSARAANLNRRAATVEQQAEWIAQRPDDEYNFLIVLKNDVPVGTVSVINIDTEQRQAEPGRFLIGEEDAVRGVPAAVEAMKLVYALVFDHLGLVRVHGHIASDNVAMMKWQRYLGMKEEGRLLRHYEINGHWQDAVLFALHEDDYRRVTMPRMKALMAAARLSAHCAVAA